MRRLLLRTVKLGLHAPLVGLGFCWSLTRTGLVLVERSVFRHAPGIRRYNPLDPPR